MIHDYRLDGFLYIYFHLELTLNSPLTTIDVHLPFPVLDLDSFNVYVASPIHVISLFNSSLYLVLLIHHVICLFSLSLSLLYFAIFGCHFFLLHLLYQMLSCILSSVLFFLCPSDFSIFLSFYSLV